VTRYFCLDEPEVFDLETVVAAAEPWRVRLDRSPFYPGGGGQLADRGRLHWSGGEIAITGFETDESGIWHLLGEPISLAGAVTAQVDRPFRQLMRELHTDLHIVNALVYQGFDGALVTGVQMNEDGTARIDFDLADADNERLKSLEGAINDVIRQDLPVRETHVGEDEAFDEPGLIRSRSVMPPPTADGRIRVVEIAGLDRQACGGTHLASTGASRPLRILKIDNKGRHNRRLRIGLDGV